MDRFSLVRQQSICLRRILQLIRCHHLKCSTAHLRTGLRVVAEPVRRLKDKIPGPRKAVGAWVNSLYVPHHNSVDYSIHQHAVQNCQQVEIISFDLGSKTVEIDIIFKVRIARVYFINQYCVNIKNKGIEDCPARGKLVEELSHEKRKKMEINPLFFKVTYKLHCIESYPFKYRTSCFKKVSSICDFIPTHGSELMCDFGSGMQNLSNAAVSST